MEAHPVTCTCFLLGGGNVGAYKENVFCILGIREDERAAIEYGACFCIKEDKRYEGAGEGEGVGE